MIVADANLVAYSFIRGAQTPIADAVKRQDPVWLVPELWRHEFMNVLVTSVRQGVLTLGEAVAVWRDARAFLSTFERGVDAAQVLTLAVERRITAYDAQYAVLARQCGVRLVTADRELLAKLPGLAILPEDFVND